MPEVTEIVDTLAGMALFADLSRPQLEGVAHIFEEASYEEGERILRQGLTGSGFYVILDGEAAIEANGQRIATLARGDFFGEISVMLDEPPTADVIAVRSMRCLVLAGVDLERFLVEHPRVAVRMLHALARRVRNSVRWVS